MASNPDYQCLFDTAVSQHGHFTSAQARSCGFTWERLSDVTRRGRFIRVYRGIYRLRDYPRYFREGVVAAWLALGKESSLVSHESALELFELSDVLPHAIHLTVARTRRHLPKLPGGRIHTTSKPFGPYDIVDREGIRLTSPGRSILDAAEAGTAPEQIEMAILQALDRGLIARKQFTDDALKRSQRVQRLVASALSWAAKTTR